MNSDSDTAYAGRTSEGRKEVVVVGAGGNIGSHLVPHLARMRDVAKLTIVDNDRYEESNLRCQDISLTDVGRLKVDVQAARLAGIRPELEVAALSANVEEVPAGRLRGDVILACLDSRRARQSVNEIAWRLGVPWVDAGVEGGNLLARVNTYIPAPDNPCLECGWGPHDYELIAEAYPCPGAAGSAHATNAPSHLGALAASLQAMECRKLLDGRLEPGSIGAEVFVDARNHRFFLSGVRRNSKCLMEHSVWASGDWELCPKETTLAELCAPNRRADQGGGDEGLEVLGNAFVSRLTCVSCGKSRAYWKLRTSISGADAVCVECGGTLAAGGFNVLSRLSMGRLPKYVRNSFLSELGIRRADILSVSGRSRNRYFEVV